MNDRVPTRLERTAAVVALLAVIALVPAAVAESTVLVVGLLFVAFTCGTVAKPSVDVDALLTFGLRSVSDDDPAVREYRERRRRSDARLRDLAALEYDPRLDRLLAVGLLLVGLGALAGVVIGGNDGSSDVRNTGRLLVGALIALNGALAVYAVSHVNADAEADD